MSKYLFIVLIFSIVSCKSTQEIKKSYENSSSRLDRMSASDLHSPALNLPVGGTALRGGSEQPLEGINNARAEDIVAKSIGELNEGMYQKLIDDLTIYIASEQKNSSKFTDEHMALKPWRDVYLILALAYMQSGDEMHAQDILDKLIFNADNWEPVYLVLCEKYFRKNAFVLARNVALKGMDKLQNPSSNIYIYYARAEISLNNLEQAKKGLESVETLYPKNPEALGWSGVIDLKLNNIVSACKKFEDSYNLKKENSSIVYHHLACLIQSHQYEQAQSVLKLGFFNSNSDPNLYYLGGVLAKKRKRPLEAQKYWENYLKLADSNDIRQPYVKASLSKIGQ